MNSERLNRNSDEQNDNDSYNFESLRAMTNYYTPDSIINSTVDKYTDGDDVVGDIYDDKSEGGIIEHKDVDKPEDSTKPHEVDPTIWQSECLETIRSEGNVILSSPTGSGKTRVFLEWAKDKKDKAEANGIKHTVYITAPIKALSNQRFRELREQGINVGLETGDVKNVPKDADYICCTQEIYTNKYKDNRDATLIMDEFHYIFEDNRRARTYIDSLHESNAQNILLASATFGDTGIFCDYVDKVSGRNFLNYENKKRITDLEYKGEIDASGIEDALVVTFSARNCMRIAGSIYRQREEQEYDTRQDIDDIAAEMKIEDEELITNTKKGVAYYFGSMLPKEKLFVEQLFEKRLIDTVVGTDALALGVNFPVQKVVFAQLAKYYGGPISKNLFEQLSGRAGRKGYFDKGEVYYCDFGVENEKYYTTDLFREILDSKNEDAAISLTPNFKNILSGKTSVNEEIEYIKKFSTNAIDEQSLRNNIKWFFDEIERYKQYAFDDEEIDMMLYKIFRDADEDKRPDWEFNEELIALFHAGNIPEDFESYFMEHPEKRYVRNGCWNSEVLEKVAEMIGNSESIPTYDELYSMVKQAVTKLCDIAKIPTDIDEREKSKYVNPELFDLAANLYTADLYEADDQLDSKDPKDHFLFHVFKKLLPDRGYETDECVKNWLAGNMLDSVLGKYDIELTQTYDDIKQLRKIAFDREDFILGNYVQVNEIEAGNIPDSDGDWSSR